MNLQRQIKRHIWSQEHLFIVYSPSSFQEICQEELSALGITGNKRNTNSLEFRGKLESAYAAHIHLRSASRIWLELPVFTAGASEELFRKCSSLPWELYLSAEAGLKLKATVRQSRIQHEGVTEETVIKAVQRRFSDAGMAHPPSCTGDRENNNVQRMNISIIKNRVHMQIDFTGVHLHKRGYRRLTGTAPIRENIAAGIILWSLAQWRKNQGSRDFPGRIHDPFCGSGTFLIESSFITRNRAPGSTRKFLFMQQPHFREQAFSHLVKSAEDAVKAAGSCTVSGGDVDESAVNLSLKNAEESGTSPEICMQDAFSDAAFKLLGPETLVITNPPYGSRLSSGGIELYTRLLGTLKKSGTPAALVIPHEILKNLPIPPAAPKIQLNNGGISIAVVYLQR